MLQARVHRADACVLLAHCPQLRRARDLRATHRPRSRRLDAVPRRITALTASALDRLLAAIVGFGARSD
jgi:hypothetical protein